MNKLARLKYLPNNFEIMEEGDHVLCAISGKKIPLEKLKNLNVLVLDCLRRSLTCHTLT